MSDEEIRDLLGRGTDDMEFGPPIDAEETWTAGRRSRGRAHWGAGLGAAAAAAAGIVGLVWTQGLLGGDASPPPADNSTPSPTIEVGSEAQGEPYLALFERTVSEPGEPPSMHLMGLSGASVPATLEDLQGRWHGPHGESFVLDDDHLTFTITRCEIATGSVALSQDGHLTTSDWSSALSEDDPDCEAPNPEMTPWGSALEWRPLLSMDGDTLLVSGLDRTTPEARVQAALTVESTDTAGIWMDGTPRTGVTPLALGEDVELLVSDGSGGGGLDSIAELYLNPADSCLLEFAPTSLRSDGILLAPEARHLSGALTADLPAGCDEGVLPGPEHEVVRQLLRSGPSVAVHDGALVISGTIPESLDSTSKPPMGDAAESSGSPGISEKPGPPRVMVLAEGAWAPSGELSPLTVEEATGRRWLPVDTTTDPPTVAIDPSGERGLSFDGSIWRVRDCGLDLEAPGTIDDGQLNLTQVISIGPDADPGVDCVSYLSEDEWVRWLTSPPTVSTDGPVLVLAVEIDGERMWSAGMALLQDGIDSPRGGPTSPVTLDDLAAGVTEVPRDVAVDQVGVSDNRDPQPEHDTFLTVQDGHVSIDVGCAAPLRGPAWFSQVGPEDYSKQLTAVLPDGPECPDDAASEDAELWRQLLIRGVFLHHFGDYVILDGRADYTLGRTETP